MLTLEVASGTGAFTTVNHLDLAVSKTSNPTGAGTSTRSTSPTTGRTRAASTPARTSATTRTSAPTRTAFYLTTNAYPWFHNGFAGAQIYALSKAQLAAGAATVTMVHIDTSGTVNAPSDAGPTQPGFTVWPAQSPGTSSSIGQRRHRVLPELERGRRGDASGAPDGRQLLVEPARRVDADQHVVAQLGTPALSLSNKVLDVNQYAIPPKQQQPGSGTAPGDAVPQGHCINDTTTATIAGVGCWRLLFGPSRRTTRSSRRRTRTTPACSR